MKRMLFSLILFLGSGQALASSGGSGSSSGDSNALSGSVISAAQLQAKLPSDIPAMVHDTYSHLLVFTHEEFNAEVRKYTDGTDDKRPQDLPKYFLKLLKVCAHESKGHMVSSEEMIEVLNKLTHIFVKLQEVVKRDGSNEYGSHMQPLKKYIIDDIVSKYLKMTAGWGQFDNLYDWLKKDFPQNNNNNDVDDELDTFLREFKLLDHSDECSDFTSESDEKGLNRSIGEAGGEHTSIPTSNSNNNNEDKTPPNSPSNNGWGFLSSLASWALPSSYAANNQSAKDTSISNSTSSAHYTFKDQDSDVVSNGESNSSGGDSNALSGSVISAAQLQENLSANIPAMVHDVYSHLLVFTHEEFNAEVRKYTDGTDGKRPQELPKYFLKLLKIGASPSTANLVKPEEMIVALDKLTHVFVKLQEVVEKDQSNEYDKLLQPLEKYILDDISAKWLRLTAKWSQFDKLEQWLKEDFLQNAKDNVNDNDDDEDEFDNFLRKSELLAYSGGEKGHDEFLEDLPPAHVIHYGSSASEAVSTNNHSLGAAQYYSNNNASGDIPASEEKHLDQPAGKYTSIPPVSNNNNEDEAPRAKKTSIANSTSSAHNTFKDQASGNDESGEDEKKDKSSQASRSNNAGSSTSDDEDDDELSVGGDEPKLLNSHDVHEKSSEAENGSHEDLNFAASSNGGNNNNSNNSCGGSFVRRKPLVDFKLLTLQKEKIKNGELKKRVSAASAPTSSSNSNNDIMGQMLARSKNSTPNSSARKWDSDEGDCAADDEWSTNEKGINRPTGGASVYNSSNTFSSEPVHGSCGNLNSAVSSNGDNNNSVQPPVTINPVVPHPSINANIPIVTINTVVPQQNINANTPNNVNTQNNRLLRAPAGAQYFAQPDLKNDKKFRFTLKHAVIGSVALGVSYWLFQKYFSSNVELKEEAQTAISA